MEPPALDAVIRTTTFFPPTADALEALAPAVRAWFEQNIGEPTPIQRGAWPVITRGHSALLSAPTGTGKTLAGLLPLLSQPMPEAGIVGLAIAPLKALVADQFKNLTTALTAFAPHVRLAVRTGDTPASERRRQQANPPHILWTTPESLAVLLVRHEFRRHVAGLRWVLVDEIHALAASKRGIDLSLSLERLEELSRRPLQRVGLSATCEPLERVARFLVGAQRPCHIVNVAPTPNIDIAIEPLPEPLLGARPGFIGRLIERLVPELDGQRTTLIFANTRNVCERIGYALKKRLPERAERFAIHHGSLAPERRREIEHDLKEGKLTAVVTSASLELGIDIGSVDGVVFVHPPGGVCRLLQRLGRSGHRPGVLKKGLMLCGHASEILEAAVTAAAGRLHQLEPVAIADAPLDVLCQHLVGMAIGRAWTPSDALTLVRRAYAYRDLSEEDFDACVRYLRGQNAAGEAWLPHRLDEVDGRFTVTSRRLARLVGRNLGTIVTEEPRLVRTAGDTGVVIGDLDDTYAKNLVPGDRFLLDGRCLTLVKTTSQEMIVRETPGAPLVPHWQSGFLRVPEALARRLFQVRAEAAEVLRDGPVALDDFLARELHLGGAAADALAIFLDSQETVSSVPDHRALLIEIVDHGGGIEYAIHTPLHTHANEAIARTLQHRLRARHGGKVSSIAVTLGVLLHHEAFDPLDEAAWSALLDPCGFLDDLAAVTRTGDLARSRFADIAHTGLMVLRQPLGGPRKVGGRDWIERRLFDQVFDADPEFALLRQAHRETLTVACDAAAADRFLAQRPPLCLRYLPEPSPFAAAWLDVGEEASHKQWHEAS